MQNELIDRKLGEQRREKLTELISDPHAMGVLFAAIAVETLDIATLLVLSSLTDLILAQDADTRAFVEGISERTETMLAYSGSLEVLHLSRVHLRDESKPE